MLAASADFFVHQFAVNIFTCILWTINSLVDFYFYFSKRTCNGRPNNVYVTQKEIYFQTVKHFFCA